MNARVIMGDCLEVLRGIEADSIDALVTDPPAGISFMGKAWDHHKGGRDEWVAWMAEIMRECHRVMKPGAHGLVWALPRTSHWTATALEDAGFEVRDVVTHLFGQGFPKSLDISKAIDKAAGAEREVVGSYKATGSARTMTGGNYGGGGNNTEERDRIYQTAPATDAAKQWQGWGTALKPASEHWILVRKPISEKNVAQNVLKHGVGGINIDGCRIKHADGEKNLTIERHKLFQNGGKTEYESEGGYKTAGRGTTVNLESVALGRFPANLVLSHSPHCTDDQCDIECAIALLDEQSGTLGNAFRPNRDLEKLVSAGNVTRQGTKKLGATYEGIGGASRFFYAAKISPSERDGSTHPTMKTQKLMRYLCRLITPPGGLVLDPFMGSGSTGLAALSESFRFIGIEREPEYFEIAEKRIFNHFPEARKEVKQ